MNARTTPTNWEPLMPQTFCSDGKTIAYTVGTGWPLMVTATTANGLIAERDTLRAQNAELKAALKDVLRIATAASMGIPGNQPRLDRARAALAKVQKEAQP